MITSRRLLQKTASVLLCLLFSLASVCCAKNTNEFGADADYFVGLQKLEEKNYDEARTKFNRCIKKGTYYCARKSAIALTTLGNIQDKNKACTYLLENFPDSETRLIAARQFTAADEPGKVLEITENLDFSTENNALIKLRLTALKLRNDSRYEDELYKWFTVRALSQEHYQFYRDSYFVEKPEEEMTPQDFVYAYRILLYRRNYLDAYEKAGKLLDLWTEKTIAPEPQLASDLGKAFLYGNDRFSYNAEMFINKAAEFENTPVEYYFWFYAGRLYDLAGLYYTQAGKCLKRALETTDDPDKFDNALWYLLKVNLNASLDNTIELLKKYSREWHKPDYFDDFFDTLIPQLIVGGKWNSFSTILEAVDGYASDEVCAQLAYLKARFIQDGYISVENQAEEIDKALTRACKSGINSYYKILAAYELGLKGDELKNLLCGSVLSEKQAKKLGDERDAAQDKIQAADNLLRGYALFGFPELIYDEWLSFGPEKVSTQTSLYLADFLSKCGHQEVDYYSKALRIASRSANKSLETIDPENLQLVYPQYFNYMVDTYCKKYDIKESVIFALIRSESFFDPEIVSNAGAIGLTQLMEMTGGDIARRLKKSEYQLTDPETNIEFGTYYLSTLYHRCDDSLLQAFFSYNAGITRVRRWLSSSMIEFGRKKDMRGDLFLETIPYTETREYGRKLVSASVMYEYLYSDCSDQIFYEMVENLIN